MNEDYTGVKQYKHNHLINLDLNTEEVYDTVGTADDILDFTERSFIWRN